MKPSTATKSDPLTLPVRMNGQGQLSIAGDRMTVPKEK